MASKRIKNRKKANARKPLILLLSLVLIIGCVGGATYAYLTSSSPEVENKMTAGTTSITIEEDFDGENKENVKITNINDPSNVDAYIRVMFVCNWLYTDDSGQEQIAVKPSWTIDSTLLNVGDGEDWFKGSDGFYYYRHIVKPGESTSNIIDKITLVEDTTDGTYQSLEILAESIQAYGVTEENIPAVEDAWKVVTVDTDKTLKAK